MNLAAAMKVTIDVDSAFDGRRERIVEGVVVEEWESVGTETGSEEDVDDEDKIQWAGRRDEEMASAAKLY